MSKEDTTQPGVSDADAAETPDEIIDSGQSNTDTSSLSLRDENMNDIVENSKKQRQEEDESLRLERSDNGSSQDELDTGLPGENDSDEDLPTIKVDGEDIRVTQEEIDEAGGVSALQKDRAASKRMTEATQKNQAAEKRNRELDEREQELARREAAIAGNTNSDQPSDTDAGQQSLSDEDRKAKARELTSKLYSGDEDQAQEAIEEILGAGTNAATNDIDIDAVVESSLNKAEFNRERQQGNKDFSEKYPEIKNDRGLSILANEETKRLLNENPDWGPHKILMESGRIIHEKYVEPTGKRSEDNDRINNKRATDQVNGASGRVPENKPEKPPTPSDVVKKMTQGRTAAQV